MGAYLACIWPRSAAPSDEEKVKGKAATSPSTDEATSEWPALKARISAIVARTTPKNPFDSSPTVVVELRSINERSTVVIQCSSAQYNTQLKKALKANGVFSKWEIKFTSEKLGGTREETVDRRQLKPDDPRQKLTKLQQEIEMLEVHLQKFHQRKLHKQEPNEQQQIFSQQNKLRELQLELEEFRQEFSQQEPGRQIRDKLRWNFYQRDLVQQNLDHLQHKIENLRHDLDNLQQKLEAPLREEPRPQHLRESNDSEPSDGGRPGAAYIGSDSSWADS